MCVCVKHDPLATSRRSPAPSLSSRCGSGAFLDLGRPTPPDVGEAGLLSARSSDQVGLAAFRAQNAKHKRRRASSQRAHILLQGAISSRLSPASGPDLSMGRTTATTAGKGQVAAWASSENQLTSERKTGQPRPRQIECRTHLETAGAERALAHRACNSSRACARRPLASAGL